MNSDVALGSAMRANLLSLQKTNALLDTTQFRLSTGKKVNSALDGAQSFFAAQSLSNRASDLSRLLDGMGQSIQTIKQADKSVTAMTKLVEQADSIAQQARDEVASHRPGGQGRRQCQPEGGYRYRLTERHRQQ